MNNVISMDDFSPEVERRVTEALAKGGYATVDELFGDAFAALAEIHRRHAELKSEIERRLEHAGTGQPIDRGEFFREMREHRSQVKE